MGILKVFSAVAASVMLTACVSDNIGKNNGNDAFGKGSGKEVTVNVKAADFQNVSIAGSFSVYFVQGNTTSVKLRGREKDINLTEVKSKGGTLYIGAKKSNELKWFSQNKVGDVDIYVTSPNLRNIEIKGSGDFIANGKIDTDEMKINIAGSGDTKIKDLICNNISVKIAGSGDVEIDKITTAEASLSIAGSGDIEMDNASIGHAESNIAGSGSIKLKGNVKSHHEKIAGSGSVEVE